MVISIPSCFKNDQRQAVIDACKISGLNVLQLINDSTAIATMYAFENW